MNQRIKAVFFPEPEVSQADTSLRYTDILFGFVIRELFLRLQNWFSLGPEIRWHLIVGTILVLGSWIGYRRSLNRSTYDVKFFNLPLFRFIVDQWMLVLYFRIAVLTPSDLKQPFDPSSLAAKTVRLVVEIFALYAIWDLLGICIARSSTQTARGCVPRYPKVSASKPASPGPQAGPELARSERQRQDWTGFFITCAFLVLFALLSFAFAVGSSAQFEIAAILLVLYRVAKDSRTTWRLQTAE